MQIPSLPEFLAALDRSRLLDRSKVDAVRATLGTDVRDDVGVLVRTLVERRLLTKFQARELLAGNTGPFFLGKFKIMRELGSGGMGTVYSARHVETRRKVAIKVLPPERAVAERNALGRFQREADVSLRLSHPHVAETLEVGEDAGRHFLVMEYIPGQNLFDMVQTGGPLRVWDAARLFREVASGLEHIHQLGIIHRDIKPSNIMVTPDGQAKLLDLGLARDTTEEQSRLTRPGTVVGTLDYLAPEQTSSNQPADERSDIYSLGCTLYFALARRPPFVGGDLMSKLYRHRMEEPELLEKVTQHVPKEFAALVRKMMAKDPADRYASAGELHRDLHKWTNADLVRSLVGSAAESGQIFQAPPPEIESAELQIDEGINLRTLGDDQPSEAPAARAVRSTVQVPVSPIPPTPLRRIKPPKASPQPEPSYAALFRVIAIIVALGVLAILGLTLLEHVSR